MNSQPVASDLSYFVAQRQREEREQGLGGGDCTCQPLYPVPSFIVNRRRFIADVEEFAGDSASPVPLARAVGEREE
jgi:hypothetical protein